MLETEAARTIIGIIGNIISFCLFTSPFPTFVTIIRRKDVEQFKPDPYVATILNCATWVFYGLPFVHPDSLLVVTINGFGLAIQLVFVFIFLIYSPWSRRRRIFIVLVIEFIFMAAVVLIAIFALHGTKVRSAFVGILGVVFNIGMYASPLTIMHQVITTKSVKYMPFYLSAANLANAVIWVIYAALKFDPYIMVPNVLGALSGTVQLILYATYYRTTNWDAEEDRSAVTSDVEMSHA